MGRTIDILIQHVDNGEKAAQIVYDEVLNFPSPDSRSNFYNVYFENYKKEGKPKIYASIIYKYIQGSVVANLGAGSNTLALGLLSLKPKDIKKVIGTDVIDYRRMTIADSRVEFRLQNGSQIPIEDNSVDTVLMITILHHINRTQEKSFFLDVWRILKPGGRIIIVEDGYSERLLPKFSNSFIERFSKLTTKDKNSVLVILDWIGTRLIPGPVKMSRPYNFRTMEEWERKFKAVGFLALKTIYLGFLKKKFTPNPQFLLLLQKPISNSQISTSSMHRSV